MTITPGDVDPATPTKLTLKFLTTNYGGTGVSAAVQVVASNSPRNFPVGATGTFVLNASNGFMVPTLNGHTWTQICGSSNTTNSSAWCGAALSTPTTPTIATAITTPLNSVPAIPDGYCGQWSDRNGGFILDCSVAYGGPGSSNLEVELRAGQWCNDPNVDPTKPCDNSDSTGPDFFGIHVKEWAEPSSDPNIPGIISTVVTSNSSFSKPGNRSEYNLADDNVLHVTDVPGDPNFDHNASYAYCNENSGPSGRFECVN
jgi:hypothetical protein